MASRRRLKATTAANNPTPQCAARSPRQHPRRDIRNVRCSPGCICSSSAATGYIEASCSDEVTSTQPPLPKPLDPAMSSMNRHSTHTAHPVLVHPWYMLVLSARLPQTRKARKPLVSGPSEWWRGQDLNLRPSGYEPDELPNCSTPRLTTIPVFNSVSTRAGASRSSPSASGFAADGWLQEAVWIDNAGVCTPATVVAITSQATVERVRPGAAHEDVSA